MDAQRTTPTPDLPLHRLQVPLPHLLPFAIGSFDAIGPLSRAGFPHRHSFYEIAHVTGGRGGHVLDLAHRPLAPPQLCVITPGQVHHWADADGLTGHVVLFNEDFLLGSTQDLAALRTLASRPALRLGEQAAPVAALLTDMEQEYRTLPAGYPGVLRASLHILIARALRAEDPGDLPPPTGRAAELAAAFTRLIAEPGGVHHSVASCAQLLGVSPGHLQTLVKQATGLPPGALLRRRQTLEAKRLLAGTELTVRQVSREAGFADPAYFCRFFRRETGMTPGEFRARVDGNHHDPRITSIAADPGAP
ncbi:AraC family transcriptional regulator [Kitasatospora sp. MMS16-BH015]|uniref:helix-turn-helix domain-containing protein n=1 Tax=Kitasatospora sp. MMS16-BH015 TaxID=2018025 RepID=UPI000CA385B7|nr:helix-turn-helix domain-containing protein [Kitasatospora sp. MMS16-BH015]AUG75656.1 AraC family transcriptional regulator [Kitasatospora sp. MMS16-BH015]